MTMSHACSLDPLHRRIRALVLIFIAGLVVSGATAIPLETELNWLTRLWGSPEGGSGSVLFEWLVRVRTALHETNQRYPFIGYGGDWLAFGHFMIALVFVGAWREPVRNRWLFDFGLLACALVVPYALICGAARGIPLWWRGIDASFGVLGAIPLALARHWTAQLEKLEAAPEGTAALKDP